MPPVKYATGTKSPGTPSEYTDAQYKALDGVKQTTPKLKYGAARAEFANHVMLPDGSLSTDLDAVRAATKAADEADVARLRAFTEEHRAAILAKKLTPAQQVTVRELHRWAQHSQLDELEASIAQRRFLFIVDADLVTRIYFQCNTPGNPDVELAEE